MEREADGPVRRRPGHSRKKPKAPRPVIGWREWVGFPELGVDAVKAKVDTGARTSSIHAFDLKRIEREGEAWIRFTIHPKQRRATPEIQVELPLLGERRVRDSGGKVETRPLVSAVIELGTERWPIELTLARRDQMGFRMLLGRQAIRGRFVVDPGRSFLQGNRSQPS